MENACLGIEFMSYRPKTSPVSLQQRLSTSNLLLHVLLTYNNLPGLECRLVASLTYDKPRTALAFV